jgi:hypothetical protein
MGAMREEPDAAGPFLFGLHSNPDEAIVWWQESMLVIRRNVDHTNEAREPRCHALKCYMYNVM